MHFAFFPLFFLPFIISTCPFPYGFFPLALYPFLYYDTNKSDYEEEARNLLFVAKAIFYNNNVLKTIEIIKLMPKLDRVPDITEYKNAISYFYCNGFCSNFDCSDWLEFTESYHIGEWAKIAMLTACHVVERHKCGIITRHSIAV